MFIYIMGWNINTYVLLMIFTKRQFFTAEHYIHFENSDFLYSMICIVNRYNLLRIFHSTESGHKIFMYHNSIYKIKSQICSILHMKSVANDIYLEHG